MPMKERTDPRQAQLSQLEAHELSQVTGGHWGVGNGVVAETQGSWGVGNGIVASADAAAARAHWGVGNG